MAKERTRAQVETAKRRAETFLRNVLDDDERADEVADESVDEYAERKRIVITNPSRRNVMVSKRELEEENKELRDEVEELQQRIDQVMDVVAPDAGDDEDEEDDDEEEDDEETDDELAASEVPARPNGVGRFIGDRASRRAYEKALKQQAVANARVRDAEKRLNR